MPDTLSFPHHHLIGYRLALELVKLVASVEIGDANLRAQARKSAASAALNAAEGAARNSRADRARVFGIARAEVCEVAAAVEIAGALGCCAEGDVGAVLAIAKRASDVLSRLASR